jgi:hypothetical protein
LSRTRFIRNLLLTVLAVSGVAAHAQGCVAPQISTEDMQKAAQDIGDSSIQSDPATVILRLTFSAPDAAPSVETVYAGGNKRFAQAMIAEAAKLRLPCATAEVPVQSLQMRRLSVSYYGLGASAVREKEPRLKPQLKFTELIRLVKDIKTQTVRFDTREMGCPFDLQFAPFRPYMANMVADVGVSDSRRAPLLEWLSNVTLDIPRDMMKTAIGHDSSVSVPCVVLDLS